MLYSFTGLQFIDVKTLHWDNQHSDSVICISGFFWLHSVYTLKVWQYMQYATQPKVLKIFIQYLTFVL